MTLHETHIDKVLAAIPVSMNRAMWAIAAIAGLALLILSACGAEEPSPTTAPTATPTSVPTPAPEPTATPVPSAPAPESAMFRSDLRRTGVYETRAARLGVLKWKFETGGLVRGSPAVAGVAVYVPIFDGNLYKVDFNTGQEVWRFETGAKIWSSPTVAAGTVYFGSGDGHLYAVDVKTGNKLWRFETGGGVVSSPAVSDGAVYFGSGDFHLYAVDIDTGQELWRFRTVAPVRPSRWEGEMFPPSGMFSSPAIADGTVYFGSDNGRLYAVDASTGQERWKFRTQGTVFSSPAIVDGVVYVTSADSFLYALDSETGQEKWRFGAAGNIFSSPAIADGQPTSPTTPAASMP